MFQILTGTATWMDADVALAAGLPSGWGAAELMLALVAVQLGLRLAGEGLTKASKKTRAKWDNAVAKAVSSAAWILGEFLGRFGYGTPSEVRKSMKN
jgi:hypothetical protein